VRRSGRRVTSPSYNHIGCVVKGDMWRLREIDSRDLLLYTSPQALIPAPSEPRRLASIGATERALLRKVLCVGAVTAREVKVACAVAKNGLQSLAQNSRSACIAGVWPPKRSAAPLGAAVSNDFGGRQFARPAHSLGIASMRVSGKSRPCGATPSRLRYYRHWGKTCTGDSSARACSATPSALG
jgi:hypothetical protein